MKYKSNGIGYWLGVFALGYAALGFGYSVFWGLAELDNYRDRKEKKEIKLEMWENARAPEICLENVIIDESRKLVA